ncbi:MAG: hypothetical protein RLZZ299_2409 [Pseudomonadota bacterium]
MTRASDPQDPTRAAAESSARQGVLMLVAAACLVVAYVRIAAALPTGAQEFAYQPFSAPPPFGPMFGFTVEQAVRHVGWMVLLGPALAFAVAGCVQLGRHHRWMAWPVLVPQARHARIAAGVGCALVACSLFLVLRGRPIVDDETAYALQARILGTGRLADPGLPTLWHVAFFVRSAAGWTAKYLPGTALLQVPGTYLGYPALLHVPLLGLTLAGYFAAVRREAGERVAAASTILLGLSPMVIVTSATGLSHAGELASVVGAGLGLTWCRSGSPTDRLRGGVLTVASLGFGLFVRPQTAVPFGAAILLDMGVASWRRAPRGLLPPLLTGLAVLGVLGWVNHTLTGAVTRLPWSLQEVPERWGFGRPFGEDVAFEHDPLRAVQNAVVLALRLNQWAFGSPWSLGAVLAWVWAGRPTAGVRAWAPGTLLTIVFVAGWYSPGVSDTGAIYWYFTMPLLALLGGHAWSAGVERAPRVLAALVPLHLVLATLPFLAEQSARLSRLVAEIHAPYDAILDAAPRPLLVLYELRPSEVRLRGWVVNPVPRLRFDSEVMTFGLRAERGYLEEVLRYAGPRACIHVRANPETNVLESRSCEDARALIARKRTVTPGPSNASTAILTGLDGIAWH